MLQDFFPDMVMFSQQELFYIWITFPTHGHSPKAWLPCSTCKVSKTWRKANY